MSIHDKTTRIALWILQGALAALFLSAGAIKLVTPVTELAKLSPLPGPFLQFIGVCEVLGALGLVLPGLFRVRRGLTPLAAAGLVVIMLGAVIVTAITHDVPSTAFPFAVGVLASLVVFGRRSWLAEARTAGPEPSAHLSAAAQAVGR